MTASVVNDASVNANALKRAMGKKNRKATLREYGAQGTYVIEKAFTIPSTSVDELNDEYHFFTFPPNTYLIDLRAKMTDMETGGTSQLLINIITDDGSTEHILITGGASFGSAAGSQSLDTTVDPTWLDVSGLDLAMKVARAPNGTAAAGTATIRAVVSTGEKFISTW